MARVVGAEAATVIELGRTLARNRRTTNKAAQVALGVSVGFTLAGATLLLALLELPARTLVDLLALVLALWMVGWLVAPSFTGGPELTGKYFRLHPLRRSTLTRGLLISAWRSPAAMVSLSAFAALVVLALRQGPSAVIVSLPATVLSVTMLIIAGRLTAIWFDAVSRSRLGASLSSLVTAAIIVAAQHSWIVVVAIMISLESGLPAGPALALRLLPSSWGLVAVQAAAKGNWLLAIAALTGLAVLVGALYLLWTAVVTAGPLRTATVRAPRRHRTPVLGPVRSQWLASLRSPLRVQDTVLSIAFAIGTCALPLLIDFGGMLPFMGVVLLLIGIATNCNMYGSAGTALWMLLLAPHAERADVRGRQSAWLLTYGALAIVLTAIGFALHPQRELVLPVLGSLLAALGVGAGLTVWLSVVALQPVADPHTAKYSPAEQGDATGTSFLSLAIALLLITPTGGLLIAGATTGSGALMWAGLGAGILTAVLTSWLLGVAATSSVRRRGPELMQAMQSGPERGTAAGENATAGGATDGPTAADASNDPDATASGGHEAVSGFEAMRRGEQIAFWTLVILGILAIIPQGLVALAHLAFDTGVTLWFLALRLSEHLQWPAAAGMIALGLCLWATAALILRGAIRRERHLAELRHEHDGQPSRRAAPADSP